VKDEMGWNGEGGGGVLGSEYPILTTHKIKGADALSDISSPSFLLFISSLPKNIYMYKKPKNKNQDPTQLKSQEIKSLQNKTV
jgi:hypothetical protein